MIAGFVPLSILAARHAENHMRLRQSVDTIFISIEQITNIILLRNHNRQKSQKSAEQNDRLYLYRWNKIYNYDMFVYCFAFIWNSECNFSIDSSICFWIWSHFEMSFRNWKCKNYTIMYRQYSDVTVNKTTWLRLNRKHLVIEWWNILQLLQLHVQIHTTMQIWSISKNVKFQQIKASDITKKSTF